MRWRRAPVGDVPKATPPKPKSEYAYAPIDDFTQEQARERRRAGYSVEYGGRSAWSLTTEVRDICGPLAGEIAAVMADTPLFIDRRKDVIPDRYALHHEVEELADGVRRMRAEVVALLAGEPGAPAEARRRLRDMVAEPGFHVTPEITEEQLRTGGWLEVLVGLVEPLEADLVAALRRVKVRSMGAGNLSMELQEALSPLYVAATVLEGRQGRIARVREAQRNHRLRQREREERERRQAVERATAALRRMKLA